MSIFLLALSVATVIAAGVLNISINLKEEGITMSELKSLLK